MKPIKVLKSGGMSTGSAQGYQLLEAEVRKEVHAGNKVVLVVSAPAREGERRDNRVTELLRRKAKGEDTAENIIAMYESIATPLGIKFERNILDEGFARSTSEDDILFLGEHAQAWQVNRYFNICGLASRWVDARDALITTNNSRSGKVIGVHRTPFDGSDDVYVIGGFYGRSQEGRTIVLPSGGSDLTADVLAATLRASEYVNLKEESGICAADPRYVPTATVMRILTYRELRELAYGGSTVLQEEAMSWSRKAGVPITVRSLFHPQDPGTRIVRERICTEQPLVGIAAKKGFVLYTLQREDDPQFFQDLFEVFSTRAISIDMIGTENGRVSIAFEESELEKPAASDIEAVLGARYNMSATHERQALVSIVGEGITGPITLQDRIIQVLDGQANARYGPILGGRVPSTTIYHIERFGMNSESGVAQEVMKCFAGVGAPITGISTTIDSISIGTSAHGLSEEIRNMCSYLQERISPDTLSVTRNGLQYFGPHRVPSNITVAVNENNIGRTVNKLYAEFF
ncbi:hypothetical protein EXS74_00135 [Candidatus Woesearchaeota archaeon]|nr:hypothetical protein [Candidatus Woesearchaeota archaeon]